MSDLTLLGVWVRRFLLEHLINERNLARNSQRSYRDTLLLLLPFATGTSYKGAVREVGMTGESARWRKSCSRGPRLAEAPRMPISRETR